MAEEQEPVLLVTELSRGLGEGDASEDPLGVGAHQAGEREAQHLEQACRGQLAFQGRPPSAAPCGSRAPERVQGGRQVDVAPPGDDASATSAARARAGAGAWATVITIDRATRR